jgi:hypothetical protein
MGGRQALSSARPCGWRYQDNAPNSGKHIVAKSVSEQFSKMNTNLSAPSAQIKVSHRIAVLGCIVNPAAFWALTANAFSACMRGVHVHPGARMRGMLAITLVIIRVKVLKVS